MKEKILEVVDLCKEYPVKRGALLPKEIGMVHAVNHVSFTLYQGETLGIIGESGCGKTTLIRMLMGLEEATGGGKEIENPPFVGAGGIIQRLSEKISP